MLVLLSAEEGMIIQVLMPRNQIVSMIVKILMIKIRLQMIKLLR